MDQLPRLGKRELICLLSFACNYVVFVWRGFLFLLVLGMGYVILLWHSLSLPYNYSICLSALQIFNSLKELLVHRTAFPLAIRPTTKQTFSIRSHAIFRPFMTFIKN